MVVLRFNENRNKQTNKTKMLKFKFDARENKKKNVIRYLPKQVGQHWPGRGGNGLLHGV